MLPLAPTVTEPPGTCTVWPGCTSWPLTKVLPFSWRPSTRLLLLFPLPDGIVGRVGAVNVLASKKPPGGRLLVAVPPVLPVGRPLVVVTEGLPLTEVLVLLLLPGRTVPPPVPFPALRKRAMRSEAEGIEGMMRTFSFSRVRVCLRRVTLIALALPTPAHREFADFKNARPLQSSAHYGAHAALTITVGTSFLLTPRGE
jgi:hypothetical protein